MKILETLRIVEVGFIPLDYEFGNKHVLVFRICIYIYVCVLYLFCGIQHVCIGK